MRQQLFKHEVTGFFLHYVTIQLNPADKEMRKSSEVDFERGDSVR
jgi:hypothetical protein